MTSADGIDANRRKPMVARVLAIVLALGAGLGLFFAPGTLVDQLVQRSGLGAQIPLLASPLSDAGRMAVAGAAALLVLLLGLAIAGRMTAGSEADDEDEDFFSDGEDATGTEAWLADLPPEDMVVVEDVAPTPPEPVRTAHRMFNPRVEIGEEGIAWQGATDTVVEDWDDADELVEAAVDGVPHVEVAMPPACDAPEPIPEPAREPLDSLSLAALGERLERAIAAHSALAASAASESAPVIAFLRREADRPAPATDSAQMADDPQTVLRSALARLTQVTKPN